MAAFSAGDDAPHAAGSMTHVFVDRATSRPVAIPGALRRALEEILPRTGSATRQGLSRVNAGRAAASVESGSRPRSPTRSPREEARMSFVRKLVLVFAAVAPAAALAAGGHDGVGCTGCHSIHAAKGEIIFAVPANAKYLNPKTNQPFGGATALCLGCHQETDKGGQGYAPISQHVSHPLSAKTVNAKVARVPGELLRDGQFECLGCHDPHPSNPYYKYLRADTGAKGQGMDKFCAVCHPIKADQAVAAEKVSLFTSMDETGNRVLAPSDGKPSGAAPAKPPAPKPSGQKKKQPPAQ